VHIDEIILVNVETTCGMYDMTLCIFRLGLLPVFSYEYAASVQQRQWWRRPIF
jgi:hypothetical protein